MPPPPEPQSQGRQTPDSKFRWVVPVLVFFIVVLTAVPFVIVSYHNSVIQQNQNELIDALREYARRQQSFFVKEKRYASSFAEIGGNWTDVQDAMSLQPTIYHGYRFRTFVSRAGKDGAEGTKFIDKDGRMTGGYAVMAIPANYGYTARLTFFISDPGDRLYYTDLGVKTDTMSRAIDQYFIPDGARSMKGISPETDVK